MLVPARLIVFLASAWVGVVLAETFPGTFEQWARERVGPVIYPEGSSRTWEEFTALGRELGARAAKTWLGAEQPGEALQRLQSEPYVRLIRTFPVLHLNLSLAYIMAGYTPGRLDPARLAAARQEWHDITTYLCRQRAFPDQVFLLSVGGEINVYFGTAGAYPEFPVADYVNACHAGKEQALAELPESTPTRVWSVAELQGDKEFDRFAGQWVPTFETDLVCLSYYLFHRDLADCLGVLERSLPARGPFGGERLMLGEYGPSLESCNWNQAAQVRRHDAILRAAYGAHVQYAFFYEIADHEAVIKTGSHDGLVTWLPGESRRLAWDYYRALYQGLTPQLPTVQLYEARQTPRPPDPGAPKLTVQDFAPVGELITVGTAVTFAAKVTNTGATASPDTTVNFFVDDLLVAWVWLAGLPPHGSAVIRSTAQDARFVWHATPGDHWATAVADAPRKIERSNPQDNGARLWLRVAAEP
jgi:hypothetical protein